MEKPLIFIVDRDSTRGNFLKYRLNNLNFSNIRVFSREEDCLYRLGKNDFPDFIITDPGHDAEVALSFIRMVLQSNPSIKIICFTSSDDQEVADLFIEAGASDIILKKNRDESGFSELVENIKYLLKYNIQYE
jgi:PleD family two-component response regulator